LLAFAAQGLQGFVAAQGFSHSALVFAAHGFSQGLQGFADCASMMVLAAAFVAF
jgi:hypothetical protein